MIYKEKVSSGIETIASYSFGRTHQIFSNIEAAIAELEDEIGAALLGKHVSSLPKEIVLNHVDHHRNFIRVSNWGHEHHRSSHAQFLYDFEQSCLAYVRVAKEIVVNGTVEADGSEHLIEQVYAVEALRGQFGKRAPYGLDSRLEQACTEVENVLSMLSEDIVDRVLYYFGTPSAYGVPSAEDLFCADFLSVVEPTIPELSECSDYRISSVNNSAYDRFKRRHSKWSSVLEKAIEKRTDAQAIATSLSDKGSERSALERTSLSEQIKGVLDEDAEEYLVQLLTEIADLNHLNLSLEPLFSFKGGVGLLQYGHIRHAPVFEGDVEELNKSKWKILEKEKACV